MTLAIEDAETFLSNLDDVDLHVAIANLAVHTPNIVYSPQPMYTRLEKNLGDRGVTPEGVKDIILFVMATLGAVDKLDKGAGDGTVKIGGHTVNGVETGDWDVSFSRTPFTFSIPDSAKPAIEALENVPPDQLRSILGKLIDKTPLCFVFSDINSDTTLSDATQLGAGVCHGFLHAGETLKLKASLIRPGADSGILVSIDIKHLRLFEAPNPDDEMSLS